MCNSYLCTLFRDCQAQENSSSDEDDEDNLERSRSLTKDDPELEFSKLSCEW